MRLRNRQASCYSTCRLVVCRLAKRTAPLRMFDPAEPPCQVVSVLGGLEGLHSWKFLFGHSGVFDRVLCLSPRALLFVCPFHLIVRSPPVSAWPLLDWCHSFAEFKKLDLLSPAFFQSKSLKTKPWFGLVCDPLDLFLPFNFDCQRLAGLAGRDVSCWTQRAAANRPDPSRCPKITASALELPVHQEAPSTPQVESQREKELDMKRERLGTRTAKLWPWLQLQTRVTRL